MISYGGNNNTYNYMNTSKVMDTTVLFILLNMVASTDARMFQMDIKDFFLQSVIPEPEYLKIKMTQIPEEIIDELNLVPLIDSKGVKFIYAEVNRAMYGLKQSNIISEKELQSNLAKHDIYQTEIKGLFRHKTRNIIFACMLMTSFPLHMHQRTNVSLMMLTF